MKRLVTTFLAGGALALASGPSLTAQWTSGRPDGHAPIGVMADHMHEKGELMLSYRYMYMYMEGSRDGTTAIADDEIIRGGGPYGYVATPYKMSMQMHMLGAMYAINDRVTLMGMVPYLDNSMDHLTNVTVFPTSSSGIGDIKLSGMIRLAGWDTQSLHAQVGLSFPTGSINQRDVTPPSTPNTTQLPYPMQFGSGTWDAITALTYLGQLPTWSWGAQASGLWRTGTNDNGYRLGHRFGATAWSAVRFNDYLSGSLRILGERVGNITGADSTLANPMGVPASQFVPTADPNLRAGTTGSVGLGVNFFVPRGSLASFRLAAEAMLPVYQNLDGPQLESDWTLTFGLQYTAIH